MFLVSPQGSEERGEKVMIFMDFTILPMSSLSLITLKCGTMCGHYWECELEGI